MSSEPLHQPAVKLANKRGAARLAAVQALYQMDLTSARLMDVVTEFENFRLGKAVDPDSDTAIYREADPQWFRAILSGVLGQQKTIDPIIQKNLPPDWPLARMETLLRSIMRAGVWELLAKKDVPAKVIINEYLDVTKAFFEEEEFKLVNSLLDRTARKHRDDLLDAVEPDIEATLENVDNGHDTTA
ncbi:MAG: transcription antitermination factor NusB [Salaquimonas sp.]